MPTGRKARLQLQDAERQRKTAAAARTQVEQVKTTALAELGSLRELVAETSKQLTELRHRLEGVSLPEG